jgi:3'-phosphoadenosine 5'-phosphosulfate sulfotransferase (PAPS reductase)/FAD synthetase
MKLKKLRVLSLGAGVQSSALALMIQKGEIPMVDCAIFADTGAEPKEVYDWLDWLRDELWFPVYIAQWRNLKEDIINASQGEYKGFTAPFYTKNPDTGKKGLLRRQCTADYKIKPVTQKIRAILGYKKGERVSKDTKVELVMGISYDEMQRMKTNQLKYIENQYPLVEKAIRRNHCIEWMEKNNYPKPPRSACTFCPFHSNEEWRRIKQNKEEWNEVVKIDKMIREQEKFKKNKDGSDFFKDKLYLHRDCKPIDEVDLREKDEQTGQYSLLDECEGMCGI